MKGATTIVTGRVVYASRLDNSMAGNPRFRITLEGGAVYLTRSNSACNYDVENVLGPGLHRTPLVVLTLEDGRIVNIEKVK